MQYKQSLKLYLLLHSFVLCLVKAGLFFYATSSPIYCDPLSFGILFLNLYNRTAKQVGCHRRYDTKSIPELFYSLLVVTVGLSAWMYVSTAA